ncbi:MAG: bifunctional pyr operon transcriptional regulator/uracil phosphoribosyltransferase PyrR [Candidatus Sumerlaeia bacterium]|nr:bifunctional pyr operon transcriptional regulator/uracil phosphoribosyltransferase PyrR [Candidatus Sumerlaeia bacterium]
MSEKKLLMDKRALAHALDKMAEGILALKPDIARLALVGIRTRGINLAERLKTRLDHLCRCEVPIGALDITLYRDDLSQLASQPLVGETHLAFGVEGREIVLVDDVLYTGRTVRAALDAIVHYGRPQRIILAVLVDRGNREYPIQPDVAAVKIETAANQNVQVRLEELDGEEHVLLVTKGAEDTHF